MSARLRVAQFAAGFPIALLIAAANGAETDVMYTVRPGEHLIGIASSHLVGGASQANLQLLVKLNALRNPNYLAPGRVIRIPIDRLITVPAQARVADAYGEATVDGAAAQRGTPVTQGSKIHTGSPGGMLIELADGSRIWVRNGADVGIATLSKSSAVDYTDTAVTVERGRVETFVNKLRGGSRFEIRSPTAKLGVRGTEFRVGADDDAARVEVLEGRVAAAGTTSTVEVSGGFGSVVGKSGVPTAPARLLAAPNLAGLATLHERPVVRFRIPPLDGASRFRAEAAQADTGHVLASRIVDESADVRFDDLPDGRYVLGIRGLDGWGLEGYGATHAFTLKARPEPPFPQQPTDRFRTRGEAVRLAWSEVMGANAYRLQIARDEQFKDLVTDERGVTGLAFDGSFPPGTYYWRLAAIAAGNDQGPFGDARRFELRPVPGMPPEPAVRDDGRVTLGWTGEPGQTFEVQLARDAQFTRLVRTERTLEPSVAFDVTEAGDYFVRIRATDADGVVGPYGGTQRFRIEPKPLPGWLLFTPLLLLLFL